MSVEVKAKMKGVLKCLPNELKYIQDFKLVEMMESCCGTEKETSTFC